MSRFVLLVPFVLAVSLSACAAKSSGGSPGGETSSAATSTSAGAFTSASSAASSTASSPAGGGSGAGSLPSNCTASQLQTRSSGTLTVATDTPAYQPWFVDNNPSNGKGFESAVAYAVAKKLGYSDSQVHWVHASFSSVIAPTPKQFDFDINEVSITPTRAKVVDFSSGYYDVAQAVVAYKNNKIAGATSIAALKDARLGAQQGTTSFDAIANDIKPSTTPREYPTNDLAVQALKNGQIDGLVVDLPTGLYVTAAELHGAEIVGQLPAHGSPEQFGLVLSKGSPLTSCVSAAVDALRADGTLHALQQRWLTSSAGAPELH